VSRSWIRYRCRGGSHQGDRQLRAHVHEAIGGMRRDPCDITPRVLELHHHQDIVVLGHATWPLHW